MAGVLLTAIGVALAGLAMAPWPLAVDELWRCAAAGVATVVISVRLGFPIRGGGVTAPFRLAALGVRRGAANIGGHLRVLRRALAADIVLHPALARARVLTAGGAYARALAATPGVMPVNIGEGVILAHVLDETDRDECVLSALDDSMASILRRAS